MCKGLDDTRNNSYSTKTPVKEFYTTASKDEVNVTILFEIAKNGKTPLNNTQSALKFWHSAKGDFHQEVLINPLNKRFSLKKQHTLLTSAFATQPTVSTSF